MRQRTRMSLSSTPEISNHSSANALHYRVELHNPNAHQYRVTLTVPRASEAQRFSLPAWIPGSYLIRDFARNIIEISASDERGAVALKQLDKHSWQAANTANSELQVECVVYAFDTSVRSAYLDGLRGFFNGTSLFLQVDGAASQACELELVQPSGALADWQAATGLNAVEVNANGFGRYRADNYQQLIDCPFEMGGAASEFERIEFKAAGVPHSIVLNGRHSVDAEQLAADLQKVCEQQISLFGKQPPFESYVFLTQITTGSYGGLEHMNSTALVCGRDDLPLPGDKDRTESYRQFLGLCSHEYFHCWNVKRILPLAFAEAFAAGDLQQEVYSGLLWAFEGITSYYDDLALVRSGLISADQYVELLGQTITRVCRGEGRKLQSVFDSSFNAWSKFYKQDANAANAIVSYYTKGSLITLALDLTLRKHGKSLDDVMQLLWKQYGAGQGVPEHGIQPLVEQVAGESLEDFFQRYVYGVEDPPLAELLAEMAINLNWRQSAGPADKGGKADDKATGRRGFGAMVAADGKVQAVTNGSPAERAGLAPGDVMLALNGYKVGTAMDKLVQQQTIGGEVELHIFRDEQLLLLNLPIETEPQNTAYLTLGNQNPCRRSWLQG